MMQLNPKDFDLKDKSEVLFNESLNQAWQDLVSYQADLIIGVPFYNEKDTLPLILRTIEEALFGIENYHKPLVLCVGDPEGAEALAAIKSMDFHFPHYEFLMSPGGNGRGASIRAMLEIANDLSSDLLILAADLIQDQDRGLKADWINRIIEPLGLKYDFVLATYHEHYFDNSINSFFVEPLLENFYGFRIEGSLSGMYALSQNLVEDLCMELKFWPEITRSYGIDPWIITRVMSWKKDLCEVYLGAKLEPFSLEKVNYVFKQIAWALFECIKRDEDHWLKKPVIFRAPDIHGMKNEEEPMEVRFSAEGLVWFFKRNFHQYAPVYEASVDEHVYKDLQNSVLAPSREFSFKSENWAKLVLSLLFEYSFNRELQGDDILNTLTTAFNGRIAGYVMQIQLLGEKLEGLRDFDLSHLLIMEAEMVKAQQHRSFLQLRDVFLDKWKTKLLEVTPPLTPSRYLEYVPGIPIVLPNTVIGKGGKAAYTEEVFNRLQKRYQEGFEHVIQQSLGVPADAPASAICIRYHQYMQELENTMETLFPGDLYSEEGVAQVLQRLFELLPHQKMYSVRDDTFKEMVVRFPPVNIMIPAGYHSTRDLLEGMDIRDTVSLANLIETRKYSDRALLWILDNLRPEGLEEVDIKYIVLDPRFGQIARLGNISNLNKITTRIVATPFNKGMGGNFPRIRFCLFIARHITIAENYAHLWRTFARERKNLGNKIRNSLIGRYETAAFSAHNIFENLHHRSLVQSFRGLAQRLQEQGLKQEAEIIRIMCDSYGLSQVLDDGTFLPLSAWSWASYNYKGGQGVPTPLSSHVEEKWFNQDLLEEIYKELGYDISGIESGVQQLIGEGRASENVLDTLLGIKPKDVSVVAQEAIAYSPAQQLHRYSGNPILSPIKEHYWENKYVLNAACLRLQGLVYILYRAYGDDQVSRIGLAVSDGYKIIERMPEPIFAPATEKESRGCEDPRTVVIDDEIYMMYTAYDGVIAQISAASIKVSDFLARNFDRWQRKGLAFKDVWNKDAILFPEKIQGKYVIYHRIEPSIWVSYLDKLEFPVPRERHAIIMGPRSGRMWDSLKIGAGTQPIKTRYGWLMIYHGVDRQLVYRLGVILVDLNNPELLIYRSPNSILQPEMDYEIGADTGSWVPNVVFTCGAVPASEKVILEDDDEILVYYGAADTHIGVATATLAELIPEEYRR
jgi:predicted GH43/DUF377 family glycosyl hydrolase